MKHYVCIQIYESDLPVPSLYFSWNKESRCVSEPNDLDSRFRKRDRGDKR